MASPLRSSVHFPQPYNQRMPTASASQSVGKKYLHLPNDTRPKAARLSSGERRTEQGKTDDLHPPVPAEPWSKSKVLEAFIGGLNAGGHRSRYGYLRHNCQPIAENEENVRKAVTVHLAASTETDTNILAIEGLKFAREFMFEA